ncbi:MAG: CopD family protein [Candidatus Krumholzibacteria bacterium]|nr:CopD family protein [Candidatus Krumholzibacteria bacterium]
MHKAIILLHLVAATIWTGGHIVLATTVLPRALKRRDPAVISDFEGPFERIGIPALLVQVATGLYLATKLLPPSEWFTFASVASTHVAAKIILVVLTLVLAAHARLRIIPRLDASRLGVLAAHIVAVTVISVLLAMIGAGFRIGGVF